MDDQADLSLHCDSRFCYLVVIFFVFSCSGSFINMCDFKLKIHVLCNKALFLSPYRSLSFIFFLFLRVTCKYWSHNSPLNNTRSHMIYGWWRVRAGLGVARVYGPWEVRTKSSKCLSHMKLPSSSRATGQKLANQWPTYGRQKACSWQLSLHNFPTWTSYDSGTTEGS